MVSCQCPVVVSADAVLPQIAVSLNYNKVYGWIDFDSISPEYISKNFDAEWKKQSAKYPMDLPNMKKLYEAVDVIGLSGGLLLLLLPLVSDKWDGASGCMGGVPTQRVSMC